MLDPKQLVGAHALDLEVDACVGDLDLLNRVRGYLMRNDCEPMCVRVGDEVVVGVLEEGADRGGVVMGGCGSLADRLKARHYRRVWLHEQAWPSGSPGGQLVAAGLQLVEDFLDAADMARRGLLV